MDLAEIENIENIPGITQGIARNLHEAAVGCLVRQHHQSGVSMSIRGIQDILEPLYWNLEYSERMNRAYADQEEVTELGAVCLSILVALANTPYTVISRSRKKTGIDYWLAYKDSKFPFENAARLEISGIFDNPRNVQPRLNKKIVQTCQSDATHLPVYISIVEFREPSTTIIKK